ncbi:hypothetical protein LWM68_43105 [Niabella sp. W65]|nr:hypothetical protein [Niabella sp. W65]MCH7368930.1 hypothetical protein [Niabella sp. W65]
MRKVLLFLVTLLVYQLTWGHAIWIETPPTGSKNKIQEIKVFFGEYADNDITPAEKWFSDLKDFKIVAIAPDGSIETLTTVTGTNHYKSSFMPKQEGVYTISLQHPVKDLYHGTKIHYFSSATVKVGKADIGNEPTRNKSLISLLAKDAAIATINQKVKIVALFEGKPAAKKRSTGFCAQWLEQNLLYR